MSSGTRRGLRNLPNSKGETLTDLLARRPELRDVGIAGYLAGAAVDGAPGMPPDSDDWLPGNLAGLLLAGIAAMLRRELDVPVYIAGEDGAA